jgi:NAD(P)-dependent dehydrogenase (short-subunit alcohol dehydrogenase family)
MRLKDKVAIITGGNQGIGRDYCFGFIKEGAKVVVAARNIEKSEALVKELIAAGGDAIALKVDVSSQEDTEMMAAKTVEKYGKIDILLNNAAIYSGLSMQPWDTITPEEWDWVFSVNVKGQWLTMKAVTRYMKQSGKGKIINTASTTMLMGIPFLAHYASSKAAVMGMTRCVAAEVGEFGINVNTICPGLTLTEASTEMKGQPPGLAEFVASMSAMKKSQQPEDLVGAALFLASDESDFISGQMLVVDGGMAMH